MPSRPTWPAEPAPELRPLLLSWWQEHGRHTIPWKLRGDGGPPADGEGLDPYGVFVAEVMLQQTQLQVVLPYWRRWMERFPSLAVVAAAQEHDVLLLWQGLEAAAGGATAARRRWFRHRPLAAGSGGLAGPARYRPQHRWQHPLLGV
jgi:A/G-specific adenine glycosylase